MNSCLLECRLLHHRLRPKPHRFTNRLFMLALDLDELPALPRPLRLFSVNRTNFYNLRERDYLRGLPEHHGPSEHRGPPEHQRLPEHHGPAATRRPPGTGGAHEGAKSGRRAPSQESVLRSLAGDWLREHDEELRVGDRCWLVTIPRVAGYQFNPVSFYFFVRGGVPFAATAEVSNTFGETKRYFLGPHTLSARSAFRLRVRKEFYVSPFSDADTEFDFTLTWNGTRLAVQIDEYQHGQRTLHSVLTGTSRPLRDRTLAWFALKYPLLSLQVILRIHTQALRLYLKGLPWHRKSDQAELQRAFTPPPRRTSKAAILPFRNPRGAR